VLGSVYALVALGYTMVYGIINLINFAHGEVLMVGALTSWTVVTVKLTESFRIRAGLGDLVKPGPTDLDNLQFHAGPGDKPVDLFIDNVAIFE